MLGLNVKFADIRTDEDAGTEEGCPLGLDKWETIPKCCTKCPFDYAETINLEKGFVDCDYGERLPGKDLNLGQPFPEYPTLWQGFNTIELGRGYNHGWGYSSGAGSYDSGMPAGVIANIKMVTRRQGNPIRKLSSRGKK